MTFPNPTTAELGEVVAVGSPVHRYAAVLLQILTAIVGAFVLLPGDVFASLETGVPAGLSLLAVALAAVGTYYVPLLGARESSVLKVALAVAGGVIASVISFVQGGDYSATGFAFLALAVLTGIATKVGVDIRRDAEYVPQAGDAIR